MSSRNMQVAICQQLWTFRQAQGETAQRAIDCLRALQDVLCASHIEVAPDNDFPSASVSSEITVLLFDGGSRGNPGPGGSGSVLATVCPRSRSARNIWFGSMSYASRTTTNNSAEYQGLIHGLRAALTKQLHQLEVIGDSAMVLRQMRLYRPPKKDKLREMYAEARYLGDIVCIKRWHHHYQQHNKMADLAVNFAMNRRISVQRDWPTDRSPVPSIEAYLANDLVSWYAQLEDQYVSSGIDEDPA